MIYIKKINSMFSSKLQTFIEGCKPIKIFVLLSLLSVLSFSFLLIQYHFSILLSFLNISVFQYIFHIIYGASVFCFLVLTVKQIYIGSYLGRNLEDVNVINSFTAIAIMLCILGILAFTFKARQTENISVEFKQKPLLCMKITLLALAILLAVFRKKLLVRLSVIFIACILISFLLFKSNLFLERYDSSGYQKNELKLEDLTLYVNNSISRARMELHLEDDRLLKKINLSLNN